MKPNNPGESGVQDVIMLEEFMYWDPARNKVPEKKLDEIKTTIELLKTSMRANHSHLFIPLS